MKKKIIIGLSLVLVLSLLASCGGIPQADLDAAIVERDAAKAQVTSAQNELTTAKSSLTTAQSNLTKAQADLKTAQDALTAANAAADTAKGEATSAKSQLSSAQSSLTKAQADLAAANKTIADLKAAGSGGGGGLSFEAATYTNNDYKATVKYPKAWEVFTPAASTDPDTVVIWEAGAVGTHLPLIAVATISLSKGANPKAIVDAAGGLVSGTYKEADKTYGTVAGKEIYYQYTATGLNIDVWAFYTQRSGKWFVVEVLTVQSYGAITETAAWEIVRTLTFQ